jgi:hypothetical protein
MEYIATSARNAGISEMYMQLTGRGRLLTICILAIAICVICWYCVYPKIILELYLNKTPDTWKGQFVGMRVDDIEERLGSPDEDLSVKEYRAWIKKTWWGRYELKITIPDCCVNSSRASAAYRILYIYGRYNPIYISDGRP